jgi:alpha-beta hydrolase superfamily lysophospholipase
MLRPWVGCGRTFLWRAGGVVVLWSPLFGDGVRNDSDGSILVAIVNLTRLQLIVTVPIQSTVPSCPSPSVVFRRRLPLTTRLLKHTLSTAPALRRRLTSLPALSTSHPAPSAADTASLLFSSAARQPSQAATAPSLSSTGPRSLSGQDHHGPEERGALQLHSILSAFRRRT